MKTCKRCGEEQPMAEFWKDRSARDGHFNTCKSCGRNRYQAKRGEILAYQRRYRASPEGRAKMKASQAAYRARPENKALASERAMKKHVRDKYGLTIEEYDAIIARGCAICGVHAERMNLDHDHANGRVRDALCQPCNHMLGNARDLPERLEAGAAYLRLHTASKTSRKTLATETGSAPGRPVAQAK